MRIKRWFLIVFVILFSFLSLYASNAEVNIKTPAWQKVGALGKEGSYTFLFFGDAKTEEGKRIYAILGEIKQELSDKKADIVNVRPDDSKEEELKSFFRIQESPVVLVIAPNGAVTGYFPQTVDKKMLIESLVSLKEAEIIKNLQEQCVVFLCFYKDREPNLAMVKTNLKAVADNFRGAVSVIYASSDDQEEEKIREKFKISSGTTTVFIVVPPGKAVAKLEGADITKENLMRTLLSACGGGSCGSGCK
jgi:thioredoxin-related protein